VDGNDFAKILMSNGLVTKATHENSVRLAPALNIEEKLILKASNIIKKSVHDLERKNKKNRDEN